MADYKGKLALVVDDESDIIDFMSQVLEDNGFKTCTAGNGKEALGKVREQKPDIVFLDLMMPEQSGMTFFHSLKKDDDYKDIPVIIVSGASEDAGVDMKAIIYDERVVQRKKELFGIDATPEAYIEKPVDPKELMATIEQILSAEE